MAAPRLGLHLTDRCQLDCRHCLRDPSKKPTDLSLSTIARILDEAQAAYGIQDVALTGGEPTLHPDFESIIDAIAGRGMKWDMVSNGRGFASLVGRLSARPARMESLRSVTFSLDGATEQTHDSIREPNSYRDVMTAAATAAVRKIPFGIQMTVNAQNEGELESLGLLAAQLGARHVSFAMTQPTGTHHDDALYMPPESWRIVRRRVERLATALSITVVLPEGHHSPARFTSCAPFRGETLHVDVHGRLTLCCLHSDVPTTMPDADLGGDLNGGSLRDAHRHLLEIIHAEQLAKLEELSSADANGDGWAEFPCNRCLARFGKPHWSDRASAGPTARRERWKATSACGSPTPSREATGTHERRRLRTVSGD